MYYLKILIYLLYYLYKIFNDFSQYYFFNKSKKIFIY